MAFPKKINIREVGPREGFQTHSEIVPLARKLELIAQLNRTGVREIEITSLVRADRVPQMADAELLIAAYEQRPGITYSALYLNQQGFERAEALGRLNNKGWIQTAVSETFLKKNSNRTITQLLDEIPQWAATFTAARKPLHGVMVSAAFGCNYEGKISREKLQQFLSQLHTRLSDNNLNAAEICLADTMGRGTPDEIAPRVDIARAIFPQAEVSLHLHDTRGTGMANVYAGLCCGVSTFDASVGGMGGCPFAKGAAGNVPSEDVAYLCESMGIETGVDLTQYILAAKLAENIIGKPLPGKLYKS